MLFQDERIWLISFPLLHVIGVASWFFHIQYDHFIRRKFPELNETTKRVFFKIFTNILVMTPCVFLIFFVYHSFHILGYTFQREDLVWGYFVGFLLILYLIRCGKYCTVFEKYKENLSQKEMLEQLNTEQLLKI